MNPMHSSLYVGLHAGRFKSYRERLTQPGESGAAATTAYEMSGNYMAHRLGRARGGKLWAAEGKTLCQDEQRFSKYLVQRRKFSF